MAEEEANRKRNKGPPPAAAATDDEQAGECQEKNCARFFPPFLLSFSSGVRNATRMVVLRETGRQEKQHRQNRTNPETTILGLPDGAEQKTTHCRATQC